MKHKISLFFCLFILSFIAKAQVPYLVKDIDVGTSSGLPGAFSPFYYNGVYIFPGFAAASNDELWKSDGTTAGTSLVKDINPGATGSNPTDFIEFNNQLFFSADNGTTGDELWKTDGTTAGTILVKDIFLGSGNGLVNFYTCWQHNGFLFFVASSAASTDNELWKTDGTSAGTSKVKDINPGSLGSYPSSFYEYNGELFFVADNGSLGKELYKTDGTTAGTVLVKDINIGVGDGLNTLGVYWVKNGSFYFTAASASASDYEIWKSDGTTAGTTKLKDIYPGANGSFPGSFYEFNNLLYFTADNGTNGEEIWRTDGTIAGTVLVKDIFIGASSSLSSLNVIWVHNGFFFFIAASITSDYEIWKSDGTTSGTTKLKDIYPGSTGCSASEFYEFNNQLLFDATTSNVNREIWKTDGTTAGTSLVLDIYPGTTCSCPNYFTILNNTYLLFTATSPNEGKELWAFNMAGIANQVEPVSETLNLNVFPNPAKDILTISASESNLTIQLFDLNGKLAKEIVSEENTTQINVSDFPAGLYFLRCRNKTKVINRKLVVE